MEVVLNPTKTALRAAAAALLLFLPFAAATAQEQTVPVRVDAVREVPLAQSVPVIGRLVPRQAGSVAARNDGAVEEVLFEVGDRVEAGQEIAILDPQSLRARRDQAAGRLAVARAEQQTKEAELILARQELDRLEGLKTSAAFSKGRYDDAKQAVAIAKAQVTEAESNVLAAEADLKLAEINLYNSKIRAPYSGVIAERMIEAGAYVKIGDVAARMISDEALELEADVPFQRLAGLAPGVQVGVTLDDGTEHTAEVRSIIPDENPLTRTRAVRFVPRFGALRKPLAANQSVTVHVPIGRPRNVLTVHKDAVTKRGTESLVHLVTNGAVEVRVISLGEAVGSRFEIINGLEDGDLVVVRGNERLRDGQRVQINGAS